MMRSIGETWATEPAARIGVGVGGIHHCGDGESQRAGERPNQVCPDLAG